MLMGRRPSLCFCIPNSRSGGRCQGAAAERDKARTGPARRGDALAWRRIPLKFTIDFQDRIYFMKFKRLGRTDISVSEICLGTMTWGSQNSQAEAHGQMDDAVEAGINFFDTAELYPTTPVSADSYGRTEEFIGSWLRKTGRRGDLVLASQAAGRGRPHIRDGRDLAGPSLRDELDANPTRVTKIGREAGRAKRVQSVYDEEGARI